VDVVAPTPTQYNLVEVIKELFGMTAATIEGDKSLPKKS
jgi:hypothetical protein